MSDALYYHLIMLAPLAVGSICHIILTQYEKISRNRDLQSSNHDSSEEHTTRLLNQPTNTPG
jgi:hypothetical protein